MRKGELHDEQIWTYHRVTRRTTVACTPDFPQHLPLDAPTLRIWYLSAILREKLNGLARLMRNTIADEVPSL
jgi:hypothetical protein